jgi:integrase
MPRSRPPRLQREITRHGRAVWYVRPDHHGGRIRIKAEFGTREFEAEYAAALAGAPLQVASKKAGSGTLKWLWDRYRETTVWSGLAPSTRRGREYVMRHVIEQSGDVLAAAITRAHIVAGRDRRKDTPAQAKHFLDTMRGLFCWAFEAEHVTINPTDNIKKPAMPKTGGYIPWTEEDVEKYEAHWPIGTKERVWLAVLLYTGLRRSDAVIIGKQHVKHGTATLITRKTKTQVSIPIVRALASILDAGPTGDLAFVCGERGQPLHKETFTRYFRAACNAAGVAKSAHGVRKVCAIRLAYAGCPVAEMNAIMGWTGSAMAMRYIEQADKARLAKAGMARLDGTTGEQIPPALIVKVRAGGLKNE